MESLRFSRSIYLKKNVEVHSEAEENSTDPVKKSESLPHLTSKWWIKD